MKVNISIFFGLNWTFLLFIFFFLTIWQCWVGQPAQIHNQQLMKQAEAHKAINVRSRKIFFKKAHQESRARSSYWDSQLGSLPAFHWASQTGQAHSIFGPVDQFPQFTLGHGYQLGLEVEPTTFFLHSPFDPPAQQSHVSIGDSCFPPFLLKTFEFEKRCREGFKFEFSSTTYADKASCNFRKKNKKKSSAMESREVIGRRVCCEKWWLGPYKANFGPLTSPTILSGPLRLCR